MHQPTAHATQATRSWMTKLAHLVAMFFLATFALAGCKTVYVLQNPDGSLTPIANNENTDKTPDTTQNSQVIMDISPESEFVVIDDNNRVFLQVQVGASEIEGMERAPMNLAIVIDRSGSMSGQKMRDARDAARWIVNHLRDGDRVSIVSYSADVRVDYPATLVSKETRSGLLSAIDRIHDGGGTFLSGGLMSGVDEVKAYFDREELSRVLLLSDGQANEGITDIGELSMMASRWREEGVTVTTMGVGLDYNEDLMSHVALSGGGNYYFIENSDALAGVFNTELDRLGTTVLRDTVLILTVPDDVRVRKVHGYQFEQHGDELHVKMNGVSAGETRKLLVELEVPDGEAGASREVAQARLQYRDEIAKEDRSVDFAPVSISFTKSTEEFQANANVEVVEKVHRVKSAEAREVAVQQMEAGNYEEAERVLNENQAEVKAAAEAYQSDILFEDSDDLGSMATEVKARPKKDSAKYKRMKKGSKAKAAGNIAY